MGSKDKLGICWLAAVLFALLAPVAGFADDFPNKPIRIIIPNAPGAVAEYTARIVGEQLYAQTGQPTVVQAKPGGGGNIGAEAVARATPDGYTMLLAYPGTHSVNVHMFKSLAYDPVKDFEPISLVMRAPYYLFVSLSPPIHSVAELVAYAKANPGKLNFGSSGTGGASHLAIVLFNLRGGVELFHIPFRGAAASIIDMMAGRTHGQFTTATAAMPHVKSGRLRVIGVTYPHRTAEFPDVPAIAETVPGYDLTTWVGLLVPARTPKNRIKRLNEMVRKALAEPDVKAKFKRAGLHPAPGSPQQFAAWIASQTEAMGKLVRAAGISPR